MIFARIIFHHQLMDLVVAAVAFVFTCSEVQLARRAYLRNALFVEWVYLTGKRDAYQHLSECADCRETVNETVVSTEQIHH